MMGYKDQYKLPSNLSAPYCRLLGADVPQACCWEDLWNWWEQILQQGKTVRTRMFEYLILPYISCIHAYPALLLKQVLPRWWFRLSSGVHGHVVVVCKQKTRLTLHRRQEYMLGQVVPDWWLVSTNCWITTLTICCTLLQNLWINIFFSICMHVHQIWW